MWPTTPGRPGAAGWSCSAAAFFGGYALLYTFVLLMDPYDTGRFPGVRIVGTGDRSPRTAAASRGRDLRFDATRARKFDWSASRPLPIVAGDRPAFRSSLRFPQRVRASNSRSCDG